MNSNVHKQDIKVIEEKSNILTTRDYYYNSKQNDYKLYLQQ